LRAFSFPRGGIGKLARVGIFSGENFFCCRRLTTIDKKSNYLYPQSVNTFPRMNIDQKNDSSSKERVRMENLGRTFFALFFMAIIVVGYLVFAP
jgi:hypothetical protein